MNLSLSLILFLFFMILSFDFGALFKKSDFHVFCENRLRAALEQGSFCEVGKTIPVRLASGRSPEAADFLTDPFTVPTGRGRTLLSPLLQKTRKWA
ncbi:hypothetical protein [Candidatus Magnetaquiglobus chichijimensis]|uniref:hypothetical protein n=1 Tax=Candidatus Magnetaquiglobus chichijimensis TaxID=3141448 RepID=UPI003B96F2EB